MENITELIRDVRAKREQIASLQSELNISLSPVLTDISLISTLYDWYKEVYPDEKKNTRDTNTRFNLCFIFVVLLLYSPQVLIGSKIKFGIRNKIAEILQYSPCTISGYLQKVEFFYERYKDYKETIDHCYESLYRRLESENLLLKKGIILH